MRLLIRAAVLLLAFSTPFAKGAGAATYAGVTLPDTYPVEEQNLVLNGMGLRTLTVFNVRAYVAGLYLAQRSGNGPQILASKAPKVILIQFLHSATKAQVEAQYRAGEQKNCGNGGCDPADAKDFEVLVAAAPAVAVGDTSTYVFTDGRVRVYANQRMIANIANRDLAFHLLEGFIGAHPPAEDLKRSLLGGQ
jgi:hypothetical protein